MPVSAFFVRHGLLYCNWTGCALSGIGGKNEVSNITPMHADVHFDSRGIHKLGSAYDKIDKLLGGE